MNPFVLGLAGVSIVLGAGVAIQTWRLDGEQRAHVQTKERYAAAQQVAKARQDAADQREGDLKTSIAENAIVISNLSQRQTSAAVDRFARANPVRLRCEAPQGGAGGTSGPDLPRDSRPVPEAPADPDLVAIPRADLDDLAEGAVQGAVKTLFLRELVDKGYAVPLSQVTGALPVPAFPVPPEQ